MLDAPTDGPTASPRPRSITAARTERQFVLSCGAIPDFVADLRQRLTQRPAPAEGLRVTTVYFDTPWGSVLETCEKGVLSERLRLREYAAATPDGEAEYWIERKRRLGVHSEKLRRRLAASEVLPILREPFAATDAFRSIASDIGSAPLVPTVTGQYLRLSFANEVCRVTLDREVSFYPPPRGSTLPLSMLGSRPLFVEPDATLEVKVAGAGPRWLDELVSGLRPQSHSKFVRGSRALAAGPRTED